MIDSRRPLFCFAVCMMAGAAAAYMSIEKRSIFIFAASAALSVTFIRLVSRGPKLIFAVALGALLVFATVWSYGRLGLGASQGEATLVCGRVVSAVPGDEGSIVIGCAVSPFEKVRVKYGGDIPIEELAGSRISFTAVPDTPQRAGNPRCYDRRRYLYGRGFSREFFTDEIAVSPARGMAGGYINLVVKCRERFLKRCFDSVEAAAFARGVMFGQTDMMEDDTLDAFRRNGTAHILVVSGLHIGILFSCWEAVRKKLKLNTSVPFAVFLLFYGTAAMWPPSVVRAAGTIAVKLIAERTERRFDMASAMSLIVILMMLKNPFVVFDPGTVMSFLAASGLTFLTPHYRTVLPRCVSAAAGIETALMPYTAYMFNYVPLASAIANIPIVFLTSLYLPAGIAAFFASSLFGIGGGTWLSPLAVMSSLITRLNMRLSFGGLFSPDIASPRAWVIVTFYTTVFFCAGEWFAVHAVLRKEKLAKGASAVLIAGIFAVSFAASYSPFDGADIVFVDVGQGDCLHVCAAGETDILVDGGGSARYSVGGDVLKPYLLKNGIKDIDLALVTHMHTDHYKGIEELSECFTVRQTSCELIAGDKVVISKDVYAEVLWPTAQGALSEDENYFSRVYKLYVNGVSVLVTGDITEEGEAALIGMYQGSDLLKSDILKVAHHGSRYSTSEAFLEAVEPSLAVISVGRNNYGHPSQTVIEKLESSGIIVYRTDIDGAIGIKAEEEIIRVCTQKSMRSEDFGRT